MAVFGANHGKLQDTGRSRSQKKNENLLKQTVAKNSGKVNKNGTYQRNLNKYK